MIPQTEGGGEAGDDDEDNELGKEEWTMMREDGEDGPGCQRAHAVGITRGGMAMEAASLMSSQTMRWCPMTLAMADISSSPRILKMEGAKTTARFWAVILLMSARSSTTRNIWLSRSHSVLEGSGSE